jgi:curved DNA-binding protein CbpA
VRIGEKARTAHADAGGSPEAFAQIKLAHDILTNEVLRKRYDETGEVDEPPPDNRRAQLMEVLSVALDHAMAKLPGREVTEILSTCRG